MVQVGREATNRAREETGHLGRKIAERKKQGSVDDTEGEGPGAGFKASSQITERARSV